MLLARLARSLSACFHVLLALSLRAGAGGLAVAFWCISLWCFEFLDLGGLLLELVELLTVGETSQRWRTSKRGDERDVN